MNNYRQLELQRKANKLKKEYKYFVGTTLKHPLQYETGEKIAFGIRVKYMDDYLEVPFIWYSLVSDDGQSKDGYLKADDNGWFYIETSISVSGFVYVQAKACDENKQLIKEISVYNGSAGADVQNNLRATKTPDDYLEFWKKLKAEVDETEPEVLFCERIEDKKYSDFEMYDMHIKAPGSDYVAVAVAHPKGAAKIV